jgi:hypothetical protein
VSPTPFHQCVDISDETLARWDEADRAYMAAEAERREFYRLRSAPGLEQCVVCGKVATDRIEVHQWSGESNTVLMCTKHADDQTDRNDLRQVRTQIWLSFS